MIPYVPVKIPLPCRKARSLPGIKRKKSPKAIIFAIISKNYLFLENILNCVA
jgi:hypothetical protein